MIKRIVISVLTLSSFSTFAVDNTVDTGLEITPDVKKERKVYEDLLNSRYSILPHKGTYLLPFVYNDIPHESLYTDYKKIDNGNHGALYKNAEAEFQISFLFPIIRNTFKTNFDLNFAYTHHAWWQIYNSDWSRPFRETNYMPEIFFRNYDPSKINFFGMDLVATDFGFTHQSNGQTQILSRSWDRIFARAYLQNRHFTIIFTGWYRLPESKAEDDNPDIYNYRGLGDLEILKQFGKHSFHYKTPVLAHHFSTDLKYSYPWQDRLRWFVSVQMGYGHSMIEYNRPTQRYGVGIVLDNFLDQQ